MSVGVEHKQPCPFCGHPEPVVEVYGKGASFAVACHACDSVGPSRDVRSEALAVWNRRAVVPAEQEHANA